MSTYAIGDVQGCFATLQALLVEIHFQPEQDTLWFAGDLVNRGPRSLDVLRYVKALPNKVVVLGNHDIHLLALAAGHTYAHHSVHDILAAPDREDLLAWLTRCPLLHYDAGLKAVLTHAGIYPGWSLNEAVACANELSVALQGPDHMTLLEQLYGDEPSHWRDALIGWPRLRFIANALTRMRFVDTADNLVLDYKGTIEGAPSGLIPWFRRPSRVLEAGIACLFGHWAALDGKADTPGVYALDTGCVWGKTLTALRLEDRALVSVAMVDD